MTNSDIGPGASRATTAWRIGASVTAAALIASAVAVVSQGIPQQLVANLPSHPSELSPLSVGAPLPDQRVVCPGPYLSFVAQETTPRGFSDPTLTVLGAEATQQSLTGDDVLQEFAGTEGQLAPAPVYLESPAAAGYLGAASIAQIDSVFAFGLVAASCDPPVSEGWLVAGSTATGRQGVLSLSNPGLVPATVDLTVYGQSGPLSAPAGRGILIQPGERRFFALSGLAPTEPSPVIQMQASGTPVSMVLHAGLTRGLEPDGADWVGLQAPPTTTRVLPGVWLESETALSRVSGIDGYDDIGPTLRLLSPDEDTTVTVRVIRPVAGDVVSEVFVQAGRVFDVALDEIGQGYAGVVLDSGSPIVAGIRHSSVGEARTDVGWLASAQTIDPGGSVVVPGGVEASLAVVSLADQTGTVRFARVAADGQQVLGSGEIRVGANGFVVRGLGSGGGAYLFETDVPVAIGVVLRGEGQLANLVAVSPPADRDNIEVFVR